MADFNELLGLDVGKKRIGAARVNTLVNIPEALLILSTEDGYKVVIELANKHNSQAIVIGLPRDINGNETDQTRWTRSWANDLKNHTNLPLFWQDEAATSLVAEEILKNDHRGSGQIDSISACIILQDFVNLPIDVRHKV